MCQNLKIINDKFNKPLKIYTIINLLDNIGYQGKILKLGAFVLDLYRLGA